MDTKSVWLLCGVLLHFTSNLRLFSVQSLNLEISPLVDKFSSYGIKFMVYWVSVSLIAKVLGAGIFGKFADKYSLNQTLRLCSFAQVTTGVFIVICSITQAWFFSPHKFFYVLRFMQSALEPSAVIFTGFLLFQINSKVSRIYLSMLVPLAAGLGVVISYYISYLINIYALQNWHLLFLGISVLGFLCVMIGTQSYELRKHNHSDVVLNHTLPKWFVFSLGAACVSAICNISFCVDRFIKDTVITENLWYLSSSVSFYVYVLVAMLSAVFVTKKVGMYSAMKFGLIVATVTVLAVYVLPFSKLFFLAVYLVHLFCVALFFVCMLGVLYDAYLLHKSYQTSVLWFTLGFALFGAINVSLQLLPLSLRALGIMSFVPGTLLCLFFLSTIKNKCKAFNLLFPISFGHAFVFKRWYMPAKIHSKILPSRFEW